MPALGVMQKDMGSVGAKRLSVKGIVTPHDWDAEGSITKVSISAADEAEYVVDASEKGGELLKLIHEAVVVSGVLKSDAHGKQVFVVEAYQALPSGEENGSDFGKLIPKTGVWDR